mmetsp:Transcript_11741/g.13510  ORF Transcript_11741/g.13510 Transcript_11741/m.13510 type:complete len:613 (-) Transcript_11741:85-1923(-)
MSAFPGGQVLGQNPNCEQGFSFQINANPNGSKLIFGSRKTVVVRDYQNPGYAYVYSGMKGEVKVAKFDRNGGQIAAGDSKGAMSILKLDNGVGLSLVKEMRPLGGSIYDLAFDADGKRLAVVGDAKGKRGNVFMMSGTEQGDISPSTKTITSVDIRPNCPLKESTLAHGSEDMRVRHFKYKGGFKMNAVEAKHENTVNCVRYSPDGVNLVSVGGKSIKLLSADNLDLVKEYERQHKGSIYAVSWSPDSKRFITSSADKTVKLWDAETGKILSDFDMKGVSGYTKNVKDMQVGCTFAGNKIVSLSLCGDINYLDESSGSVGRVVQAPTGPVNDMYIEGDQCLAVAEGELFSYMPDGIAKRFTGYENTLKQKNIVVNGDNVYTTSNDDKVLEGSLKGESSTGNSFSLENSAIAMSKAQNGNYIVVTSKEVYVFEANSTNPSTTLSFGGKEAKTGAISPEGDEISIGFKDKMVRTYSYDGSSLTDTGKTHEKFANPPSCMEYNDKFLIVGTENKFMKLFDRSSWEVIAPERWCFHNSKIESVSFSPSGKYIASTGLDGYLLIWDTAPEKPNRFKFKKDARAHLGGGTLVRWIDDNQLYSTGGDGAVKKWDITKMK